MLGWLLLICIPLPLIVFTLNPKLFEDLNPDKDKPDCEDPVVSTTPLTTSGQIRKQTWKEYLFKTRNSVLQTVLAGILYGGFGVFFLSGYHYLPEGSVHRWLSVVTVCMSVISFSFATMSPPTALYSPIHKDYIPPELDQLKPTDEITPEILNAVNERFQTFWNESVGRYRYDNTIFFANTWCRDCRQPRPARSQHCSLCGVCVGRADHHCWWLNQHIGQGNYHIFFILLVIKSWLTTYGSWVMYRVIQEIAASYQLDNAVDTFLDTQGYNHWFHFRWVAFQLYKHKFLATKFPLLWVFFALIWTLSVPVVLFTCYQVRLILFNYTQNEDTKRQYMLQYLKATQKVPSTSTLSKLHPPTIDNPIPLNIEGLVNTFDTGLLSISDENERETYKKTNGTIMKQFFKDKNQENDQVNASNGIKSLIKLTDQLKSTDDEVVGCVPTTSSTNHINTNNNCDQKNNNNNECSTCESNKPSPIRIPFPTTILNPSTYKQYTPTKEEEYMIGLIKEQQRSIGFEGWFEPKNVPFITPSITTTTSSNDQNDGQNNQNIYENIALPPPSEWVRNYYTYCLDNNIYDMGSMWTNLKDAFGLLEYHEYKPFNEYDLKMLLQLKADWDKLSADTNSNSNTPPSTPLEDKKIK